VFVTDKLFEPSLMFAGKTKALGAPLLGWLLGLPTNKTCQKQTSSLIRALVNYNSKSFQTLGPDLQVPERATVPSSSASEQNQQTFGVYLADALRHLVPKLTHFSSLSLMLMTLHFVVN
jgi:hypothetical protein